MVASPAALQARGCEGDVAVLLELLARECLGVEFAFILYRQGDAGLCNGGGVRQGVEGGRAVFLSGKGDRCRITKFKTEIANHFNTFHVKYCKFLSFAHPGKGHAPLRVPVEVERDGSYTAAFIHLVDTRFGIGDIPHGIDIKPTGIINIFVLSYMLTIDGSQRSGMLSDRNFHIDNPLPVGIDGFIFKVVIVPPEIDHVALGPFAFGGAGLRVAFVAAAGDVENDFGRGDALLRSRFGRDVVLAARCGGKAKACGGKAPQGFRYDIVFHIS